MPKESNIVEKILDKFFGGMTPHDKSQIAGSALNMEELDIFGNENWIQAEQIMSAEAAIADTTWHAFDVSAADTLYAYGIKTSTGVVRIVKVTTAGVTNPGDFATHITSADTTNLAIAAAAAAATPYMDDYQYFEEE